MPHNDEDARATRGLEVVDVPPSAPVAFYRALRDRWYGVGQSIYRLPGRRLTPDGFAITRQRLTVNGEPYSEDDRPRFVTPDQQALMGWLCVPWLVMPFVWMIGMAMTGGNVTPSGNVAHILLFVIFVLTWAGCVFGTIKIFLIVMEINEQIYDDDSDA